jgi:hypothetical protein
LNRRLVRTGPSLETTRPIAYPHNAPIPVGQSCCFAWFAVLAGKVASPIGRQKHRFARFCGNRASRQRRATMGAMNECVPRLIV